MSDEFPIIIVTQEAYELSKTEAMGSKYKFWFEHPELGRCPDGVTTPSKALPVADS